MKGTSIIRVEMERVDAEKLLEDVNNLMDEDDEGRYYWIMRLGDALEGALKACR